MSTVTVNCSQSSDAEEQKKLWCNFCNFATEDTAVYLSHSCVEELEKQGKKIVETGNTECR